MKKLTRRLLLLVILHSATAYSEFAWQEIGAATTIKDYTITALAIGNKETVWALGVAPTQKTTLFKWDFTKKNWHELPKNLDRVEAIAAVDNLLFAFQKQNDAAKLYGWNGNAWQEMYSIQHARIGSLSTADAKTIYAIVNEKPYMLQGQTWTQLGTIEGFREISASNDGTLYARRFNFEAALKPDTAFPAFSLELVFWNGSEWRKAAVEIAEKERGIMNIATQNKNSVWCVIREENGGGKIYQWLPESQKLDRAGDVATMLRVATCADGTTWALSYAENPADRKIMVWAEVVEPTKPAPPVTPTPSKAPEQEPKKETVPAQAPAAKPQESAEQKKSPENTPVQPAQNSPKNEAPATETKSPEQPTATPAEASKNTQQTENKTS